MIKAERRMNEVAEAGAAGRKPRPVDAFVVDDENEICLTVSTELRKLGLTVATYDNAGDALAALAGRAPRLIFLDVALRQSDAIDVIKGLGERQYTGVVQLFSSHRRLLDPIRRIAVRYHLTISPPLTKPLGHDAIRRVVAEAGMIRATPAAH
jgi:DNA-binding NtrC family response regulator